MTEPNPYSSNKPLELQTEKLLAVGLHLLAIPFEFFAPVFGYLVFKDKGPFITHHVRESLNFGITMLLLVIVLAVSIVGWILLWVPPVIWLVLRIVAAIKASQGEYFRYPLTLRLFKA